MALKHVDSFTNVDVDALTREEKEELRRIKKKVENQREYRERKRKKKHFCIRYHLWFYVIILVIATLFIFSVVFGVTSIRNLGLKPPSCVISADPFRLPMSVYPLDYNVRLRMNFSGRAFDGRVDITLLSDANTYCLFFHVDPSIYIKRFYIMDKEAIGDKIRALGIRKTKYDAETQIYQVKTEEYLHLGKEYNLHISYSGTIREENLEGIYVSYYEHEGVRNEVFSTHFESSAARAVFPCFDEPRFKSVYTFAIDVPKTKYSSDPDFKIVANMPLEETVQIGSEVLRHIFKPTPKMSTYLIAFAMGPLQFSRYLNVTVIVNKNVDVENTQFILRLAHDVVTSLSTYFGYNFFHDIKKLDLIGLSNFRAGAMENWGLITFREHLLITPSNSSVAAFKRNAYVTAHEISHQWIGNLVSPKWWSDIFLSEGGATFFQYLAIDLVHPEWDVWEDFVVGTVPAGLEKDALPSSPSLTWPVEELLQVKSKFDSISYNKGGSVLRMFWDYLGPRNFQTWFQHYIAENSHSNANHTNFLENLYPYVVKDYAKIEKYYAKIMSKNDKNGLSSDEIDLLDRMRKVSSWWTANGYPVITVERIHGNSYRLHQARFVSFPSETPPLDEGRSPSNDEDDLGFLYGSHLWWIPIKFFTSSVSKEISTIIMTERSMDVTMNFDWFKLNADSVGFYRVNYTPDQWRKLGRALYHPSMTVMDRASLINDVTHLGWAGHTDIGIGLEMMLGLKELELKVWKTVLSHAKFMSDLIRLTISHELYQHYINDLSFLLGEKIGWLEVNDDLLAQRLDIDKDSIHELRRIYISFLGLGSNETAINQIYAHYINNLNEIPGYLLYDIGILFVNHGDNRITEFLWEKFEETKSTLYLNILGQSFERVHFVRVLDETIGVNVLSQDGHFVIRSVASNVHATDIVFDWLRENIYRVSWKYGLSSLNNIVLPGLANYFSRVIKEKDLESFFGQFAVERSLVVALETVARNRWWLENIHPRIREWLLKNYD